MEGVVPRAEALGELERRAEHVDGSERHVQVGQPGVCDVPALEVLRLRFGARDQERYVGDDPDDEERQHDGDQHSGHDHRRAEGRSIRD